MSFKFPKTINQITNSDTNKQSFFSTTSPVACSCDSPWSALARSAAGPARCRCPPHGRPAPQHLERDWLQAEPLDLPPRGVGGWCASSAHGPGRSGSLAHSPGLTQSLREPRRWPQTDTGAACRRANSALWQARLYPWWWKKETKDVKGDTCWLDAQVTIILINW